MLDPSVSWKDLSQVVIKTERLRLRPLEKAYCDEIFEAFTGRVAQYMYAQPTGNEADTMAFILKSRSGLSYGTELPLVILDWRSGDFLGCTSLCALDTETPEVGIWLAESAQGKGYGLEVVTALKRWADKNVAYTYLAYVAAAENLRSQRIAEKMGGVWKREFPKENSRGVARQCFEYHIPR